MYTENVLKQACHVPSDSELASLFTLINRIKRDETVTNANNGIVYRTMMERLKIYWVSCFFLKAIGYRIVRLC
jgi:hypothetical protein